MTHRVYVITFLLGLAALVQAQTFTVLYSFSGGSDGGLPVAGVIQDKTGNVYGTTEYGGDLNCNAPYGCGVVYKLDTAGTETLPYTFCLRTNCVDGANPTTAVVRNKAGNLYGATYLGGAVGLGTVFRINAAGHETVLHSFSGGPDGCLPYQDPIVGKSGVVLGTTSDCGSSRLGTIYRVDSAGKFTLLHSFTGGSSDGASPFNGHLTMDKSGSLYGVTYGGGAYGFGALYKLSERGTFTVLHSFAGGTTDGCGPGGTVVRDTAGNLYGTAGGCDGNNYGTVWKVSKKGKETILHNFAGGTSDGCNPGAGVARDSRGNLYGVTFGCGANSHGALYKLSASGKLTLLHSFDGSDGDGPLGEVLRTTRGTIFGTTQGGGNGYGTVWSYVPKPLP